MSRAGKFPSPRVLLLCAATAALVAGARADTFSYDAASVGPLHASPASIEPTSPVLGTSWAQNLRNDPRDPEEILNSIDQEYPHWEREVMISSLAYLKTLEPGLIAYCDPKHPVRTTPPPGGWTEVLPAAIPLQVLQPLQDQYASNVLTESEIAAGLSDVELHQRADAFAHHYQSEKEASCGVVMKFDKLEHLARKLCLGGCKKLIAINHRLSAPEAAYPRLEFSINGYTQYVYGELMKMAHLRDFLRTMYRAETDWVADASAGTESLPFMTFVENRIQAAGFTARQALLGLSYSTRNMPSLDVHYGYAPRKALALEVYFWKFHQIRSELVHSYLGKVFPNHVFKEDPGLYHYSTAALLACELYEAGYVGTVGRKMAMLSKLMYKLDKLTKEAGLHEIEKHGIRYLFKVMKEQGFVTGVEAGRYGGKHGVSFCKADRAHWHTEQLDSSSEDLNEIP